MRSDRAVAALQESDDSLRAIVDSTSDFIWSVDAAEHGLLWFNEALRTYFLERRGMVIRRGQRPQDLFDDQSYIDRWHAFYDAAQRDGEFSAEYEASAGSAILELNLRALVRDGEVYAVSVFGRDVTEQRQAAEHLAASEAKYRSVVMAMAEGVMVQDADGRVIETNPAAQVIEGRTDREMIGHTSDDPQWGAVHVDGSAFPGDEHPSMVTLRTGEAQSDVVMGIRRPSGERRWISINSQPVRRAPDGHVDAVVTTFHDITERRQMEYENQRYVDELESAMNGTLRAVAAMVELRDPYTAGHMQRVGQICEDIARELGWSHERAHAVALAGMVHDIGKIAVPAELLSKPRHLTPLEFQLIKSHVDWSYEILENVHFPFSLAEVVRQHHERLDGSGYPRGLVGDEILPEARVLAAADTLESMAAHRPYRAALGVEAAIDFISAGRGTLFDPDVVDALCRMIVDGYELPDVVARHVD